MAVDSVDLAQQVLREQAGDWQTALVSVQGLPESGRGDYPTVRWLLRWRLASLEAFMDSDMVLKPVTRELRRAAEMYGYDQIGIRLDSLVLRAGCVTAAARIPGVLPVRPDASERLVRWLNWQFDDLAQAVIAG